MHVPAIHDVPAAVLGIQKSKVQTMGVSGKSASVNLFAVKHVVSKGF